MDYDYNLYDTNLEEDQYYYDDDETEEENITIDQLFNLCLKPTLLESFKTVYHVFLWCFLFRLSTQLIKNPSYIWHIFSFLAGLLSLHVLFSTSVYYIVSLVLITYILLFIATYFKFHKHRGVLLILSSLCYLGVCELWLVDSKQWHRIRGSQMIVVMKSVSLAFDLDIGTVKSIPNLIYYSGYILCPSSCVFGPWTSYNDYILQYKGEWSFKQIQKIILKFLLAFTFLSISACWSSFFIAGGSFKWLTAYKDALSFRTSHYFISYLSEVTLLLSGYSSSTFNTVTNPLLVEFPRSIVNVVIYWNIPMHNWLKIYIFNTSRKYGNFVAILFTYAVSSSLHGFNFQLSAVLLSLGVYSYVEVMLRKKLGSAFSACILAKSCKPECTHKHKKYHPLVLLTNALLLMLTIFHLAYLGVVFDINEEEEIGYTWRHSLKKWASLNYLSHYIAFLTYIMYFFIR